MILSTVGLLTASTFALVPGSGYADSPETVEEAEELVDELTHEAAALNERVNDHRLKVKQIDRRLDKIDADMEQQHQVVDELRDQIGGYAAAEYRSGGVDTTTQLLAAEDPDEFLAQMSSAEVFAGQQGRALTKLLSEEKKLSEQEAEHKAELAEQREAKQQVSEDEEAAEAKLAEAEQLLERLTEEERQRMEAARTAAEDRSSRDDREQEQEEDYDAPPASGRGGTALAFAEAQIGMPYVFGSSGPDGYDCSGLTMAAWAEAGVSLPHSSRSQYSSGTQVSRDDLQPGDLVIFYSDMHHVGIYAGNDEIVHAPRPGTSVEKVSIDTMPYTGAVRPG